MLFRALKLLSSNEIANIPSRYHVDCIKRKALVHWHDTDVSSIYLDFPYTPHTLYIQVNVLEMENFNESGMNRSVWVTCAPFGIELNSFNIPIHHCIHTHCDTHTHFIMYVCSSVSVCAPRLFSLRIFTHTFTFLTSKMDV